MLTYNAITPGSDVEIIRGLFYSGEIVTLTGGFNVAKTPLLRDWAFCVSTGTPWCGRPVAQRPVLLLAHESTERKVIPDWHRLAAQKGVPPPSIPDQFQIYMEAGSLDTPANVEMLDIVAGDIGTRLGWLKRKVLERPTSLVIIDPFDMFFRVKKNESQQILAVYHWCRMLRREAPLVTFIFSFNMRKRPRVGGFKMPELIEDPHGWLEEASGAIEIQSRSDARFGIAYKGSPTEGIRVLHGTRREDTMEPVLLRSIVSGEDANGKPLMAGFEQVAASEIPMEEVLAPKQLEVWMELDIQFTFTELMRKCSSRPAGYRLRQRLLDNHLIREIGKETYEKCE